MNRREFLWRSSAAAALGAASGFGGGCATEPSRRPVAFPLSTSSLLFREMPIEAACAQIAGLGFEAIDIWSAYEGCPHLDDVASRLGGGGLREVLDAHRLRLFAFSTYVGGFAKYARFLGEAGGGVAVQGSAGPCPPGELIPRFRAFFEALRPLADLAEENQSWLAIENHGQALLDGLDSIRAFVDLNPYPRVGIALAPYHLQAAGASVPEAILIAGRQLFFFYAWQNGPELAQLPGHGAADFQPWLQALATIGYRGCLNVFMHGHLDPALTATALTQAQAYLRRVTPFVGGPRS